MYPLLLLFHNNRRNLSSLNEDPKFLSIPQKTCL